MSPGRCLLVAAITLAAACGDDTPVEQVEEVRTATTAPVPDDTAASTSAGTEAAVALDLVEVATLDAPVMAVARPGADDELWVGEREGRVRVLDLTSETVGDPVIDLSDDTTTSGERGLLGLAFSPDGDTLYVSSTGPDGESRLEQVAVDPDGTVAGSDRTLVLEVPQPASNHNGGHVVIGPDGYLWFGLGDGGGSNDEFDQAQDADTLLGALLRIDPAEAGESGYAVPDDNPFVGGGGRPEIWAVGLRNPWRFSFDPATDDLWIGDVGQGSVEEVTVLRAADGWSPGANLGWPQFEGNRADDGTAEPDGYVGPIFDYSHDDGCSVTGGVVYRGTDVIGLDGVYLFGDYCREELWALVPDGSGGFAENRTGVEVPGGSVVSFATDATGEIYVLSLAGGVFRVVPA